MTTLDQAREREAIEHQNALRDREHRAARGNAPQPYDPLERARVERERLEAEDAFVLFCKHVRANFCNEAPPTRHIGPREWSILKSKHGLTSSDLQTWPARMRDYCAACSDPPPSLEELDAQLADLEAKAQQARDAAEARRQEAEQKGLPDPEQTPLAIAHRAMSEATSLAGKWRNAKDVVQRREDTHPAHRHLRPSREDYEQALGVLDGLVGRDLDAEARKATDEYNRVSRSPGATGRGAWWIHGAELHPDEKEAVRAARNFLPVYREQKALRLALDSTDPRIIELLDKITRGQI